jgi:hypothetical protein
MAETTVTETETDNKKIHFDITKHTSDECLTAINTLTNGAITCSQKVDFFTKITELIAKRNNACWYGSIDSPTDVALLKQTIGKGGLHLKRLTVKYGAYIIWHNRTDNKFTVWASKPALISTLHALLRHINKAIVKQAELKQDVLTMEESMTVLTLPPQQKEETTTHREREDDDGVEPVAKKIRV